MAKDLNAVLHDLRHLQRLNFAYCNLKGHLELLIGGLKQRLAYLNLRDCRLVTWAGIGGLNQRLAYLKLRDCRSVTWAGIGGLKQRLAYLNLRNCRSVARAQKQNALHLACEL